MLQDVTCLLVTSQEYSGGTGLCFGNFSKVFPELQIVLSSFLIFLILFYSNVSTNSITSFSIVLVYGTSFFSICTFFYIHSQQSSDSSVAKVAILQATGSPQESGFPPQPVDNIPALLVPHYGVL